MSVTDFQWSWFTDGDLLPRFPSAKYNVDFGCDIMVSIHLGRGGVILGAERISAPCVKVHLFFKVDLNTVISCVRRTWQTQICADGRRRGHAGSAIKM